MNRTPSRKRVGRNESGSGQPTAVRGKQAFWRLVKRPDYFAAAFLVGVTIAFYSPVLSGAGYIWHDFIRQYYPYRVFAARMLGRGEFPFWNPYVFSGMPFFADMQTAVLYPLNLVLTLFRGREMLGMLPVEYVTVLHVALAGVSMYVLMRCFDCRRAAATASGLIYMLGGFGTAHIFHVPMIHLLPWIPLLIMSVHRLVCGGSMLWMVMTALIGWIAVLSGHPQLLTYTVYFLSAFAVYLLVVVYRERRSVRVLPGRGALLAAAGALALGLSSVQLLPARELARHSVRGKMSYERATEGSLSPYRWVTLIAPNFFGTPNRFDRGGSTYWGDRGDSRDTGHYYWETAGYVGIAALLAALAAVAFARTSLVMFFACSAAVALMLAMGDSFFLYQAFFELLPGLDRFRIPGRWLLVFCLSIAVVAGFGIQWFLGPFREGSAAQWKKVRGVIIGACVAAVGAWLLAAAGALREPIVDFVTGAHTTPAAAERISRAVNRFIYPGVVRSLGGAALLVCCCAGLVVLYKRRTLSPTAAAVSVIALVTVDLFAFGFGFAAVRRRTERIFAPQRVVEPLRAECREEHVRVNARDSKPGSSLIDGDHKVFDKNQGTIHGIFLTEGYNPLRLERNLVTCDRRTFDLLSVKYRTVYDSARGIPRLVHNPTFLKRARMVYNYEVVREADSVLSRLYDPTFDYRSKIILEQDPVFRPGGGDTDGPVSYSCRIREYRPNEITVEVSSSRDGFLVLSEIYYPSWSAEVDGEPAPVLRANYALRAIPLRAGTHTVRCRYSDPAFRAGLFYSAASLLAVAGLSGVTFGRRRSRRRKREEHGCA